MSANHKTGCLPTIASVNVSVTTHDEALTSSIADQPTVVKHGTFPQEVYDNLPELLKAPCNHLLEDSEKGLFLAGALGVVSGILPNVKGYYFSDEVKPNLYCYVLGNYGTGKGGLKHARRLGEAIHKKLHEQAKQAKLGYNQEVIRHRKRVIDFEKGKIEEAPQEPTPPPHKRLFIPANTSSSAVKQLLEENGGRCILFETEGDTLTNTLKQDFGNYSDDLRKAFHHEPISFFRRTNNEDVEINSPCLSVVLSSTFDQFLRLVPNIENGLFSRFCYYWIEGDPRFKNPFDKRLSNHSQYFSELGDQYLQLYERLSTLEEPIWFELSEQQQVEFNNLFKDWKKEIREHVSVDLDGTVNRLGLICFRICMVLRTLRAFDQNELHGKLICTNEDFNTALDIVDVFRSHALDVFMKLSKPNSKSNSVIKQTEASSDLLRKCIELHKDGKSIGYIALHVYGSINYKSKVHRIINKQSTMLLK